MATRKKLIDQQICAGERALYKQSDLKVVNTVFENGESPLKECRNIDLPGCLFQWKSPLWYCENIALDRCTLFENARAGVWYSSRVTFKNTDIKAPKNFRRCKDVTLENVNIYNADETIWSCDGVTLKNVTVGSGNYFAMNSKNIEVDGLTLNGNYCFDGAENVVIRNSRLLTKDAFWNSKNVTVYDSLICGEYLGWNSENLTLVNCTVETLQGLCFIDRLKMVNCRLINTTLAFEYSDVDAEITGKVGSVFNPRSGTIKADRIDELIIEKDKIDPDKTKIICNNSGKQSDRPEWLQ